MFYCSRLSVTMTYYIHIHLISFTVDHVHPSGCFREMSTAPPSLRDGLSAASCASSALMASMSAVSAAACGPSRPRVGTKPWMTIGRKEARGTRTGSCPATLALSLTQISCRTSISPAVKAPKMRTAPDSPGLLVGPIRKPLPSISRRKATPVVSVYMNQSVSV